MSFEREAAVRQWRLAILSRGGLTVSEVDELEDHLEHVESGLRERVRPEEAFWLAAHRLGTPEALTREFGLVRPNLGWELRAQWALLGLLAYWLVVPLMRTALHLLAVVLAGVAPLSGVAAALVLYASPLGLVLTLLGAALVVRRFGASPASIEAAVGFLAANARPVLPLAALGVIGWQVGVTFVGSELLSRARGLLYSPGQIAPLQSELWYSLFPIVSYALPALALVLVVWLRRRLERASDTEA
ncbi:MAG: hypothetical protein ROY82_08700 [Truepera sp.]|nr:hypothetical protein [Truepera sp.]